MQEAPALSPEAAAGHPGMITVVIRTLKNTTRSVWIISTFVSIITASILVSTFRILRLATSIPSFGGTLTHCSQFAGLPFASQPMNLGVLLGFQDRRIRLGVLMAFRCKVENARARVRPLSASLPSLGFCGCGFGPRH